ncbi:MAG: oligosaccharide flippase family protein [Deltaproteobacteria bacterium]|nr:oligosaccharide flippase family protein [Deltaproteobacteria bacterium]
MSGEARPSEKGMSTEVNRGLAWIGIASSLVGILDLLAILIILNNWVDKEQYGIATLANWMFPILDQATDLGLSAAVIQREDHDDAKISTVFWINLMTASALFMLLLVFAPLIGAGIYGHAIIGYMLIAYGSKLLWQNVYFIPVAMMKRELRFKELSIIRICSNLAEFAGKVGFAAAGFGIWCFVLGPLARVLVTGIGAQICHPWRPKLILRFTAAKEYVTFGLRTSGSQILFYMYTNVDYPIVGYFFGPTALGVYKLAYEVVLEPVRMISNVVVDIAFPAFARLRYAKDRLIGQLVSFTKLNLITVMAYSAVVLVAAPDVLEVFFPKYTSAVDAIRILCIVAVFRSVSFVVPPMLDGIGYPNRTFVYSLIAAIVLPATFWLGAVLLGDSLGYMSVAVAWAIGYPIAFAVLIGLALSTLKWTLRGYLGAVGGVALCLIAAALVAWGVHAILPPIPGVRLAITAVVVVTVTGALLAYTQNLSIRSAIRAIKGDGDAVLDDPAPPVEIIPSEPRDDASAR